jgi:probable HAF family extracellular repeat protein
MAQYLNRMVSVRAKRSIQADLTLFDIFPAFGRVDEDVGSGCLQDLEGDGNYAAQANAISADGTVIVGARVGGHAWKYAGGNFTDLGTLGGATSAALAVSADGAVIAGVSDTPVGPRAFRYAGGPMENLGVIANYTRSQATGVSADGSEIVGTSDFTEGNATIYKRVFRYVNGALDPLGALNHEAWAVSADGSTITGRRYKRDQDFTDSFAGYFFRNGQETWIDAFFEGVASSRDGSIIVGRSSQYTNRYENGQISSLGQIFPRAVTPDGSVVVGMSSHRVAVKISGGRVTYLGLLGCKLRPGTTLDCDGPTESVATGVSSDGKRIVGYSTTRDGTVHPFLYEERANP